MREGHGLAAYVAALARMEAPKPSPRARRMVLGYIADARLLARYNGSRLADAARTDAAFNNLARIVAERREAFIRYVRDTERGGLGRRDQERPLLQRLDGAVREDDWKKRERETESLLRRIAELETEVTGE